MMIGPPSASWHPRLLEDDRDIALARACDQPDELGVALALLPTMMRRAALLPAAPHRRNETRRSRPHRPPSRLHCVPASVSRSATPRPVQRVAQPVRGGEIFARPCPMRIATTWAMRVESSVPPFPARARSFARCSGSKATLARLCDKPGCLGARRQSEHLQAALDERHRRLRGLRTCCDTCALLTHLGLQPAKRACGIKIVIQERVELLRLDRLALAPGDSAGRRLAARPGRRRDRADLCLQPQELLQCSWRACDSRSAGRSSGRQPERARQHLGERFEVAERLAHLLAVDVEQAGVHPERWPWDAGQCAVSVCAISFSWCGKIEIGRAAVDVELVARVALAHRRALDVPAGRPGPHGLAQVGSPGLAFFHSAKSSGSRFLLANLDARAGAQLVDIAPAQARRSEGTFPPRSRRRRPSRRRAPTATSRSIIAMMPGISSVARGDRLGSSMPSAVAHASNSP